MQNTGSLVEIHNSDPVTNLLCFFIYNVNDNLDDLDDLELFQLMNEKMMRAKTMTLDSKQTHLHINHQSQYIKIMTNMDEMHTAKSLT